MPRASWLESHSYPLEQASLCEPIAFVSAAATLIILCIFCWKSTLYAYLYTEIQDVMTLTMQKAYQGFLKHGPGL